MITNMFDADGFRTTGMEREMENVGSEISDEYVIDYVVERKNTLINGQVRRYDSFIDFHLVTSANSGL